MKINLNQLLEFLVVLTEGEAEARHAAVNALLKYSEADWQSAPEAVTATIEALVGLRSSDRALRAQHVKILGNIGAQSPAVVPELTRLLQADSDSAVRTEAARALGKIGEAASSASRVLTSVLNNRAAEDALRGEAARALARVAPQAPATLKALRAAADDPRGHVGVCAAEALWRVDGEPSQAVTAIAGRLRDPAARDAAVQALYRIGPKARAAVPALLVVARSRDRLFHESVVMALTKIDPEALTKLKG